MRAIRCNQYGPPESLNIEELPDLVPQAGQITIDVKAASVNFPDVLMLSASYQHKPELPFIPGMEGAGTITAVGGEVKNWKAGDKVIFGVRPGAMAEYVRARTALRTDKCAHVFDDAEHRDVDAAKHGNAAPGVDQGEILRG